MAPAQPHLFESPSPSPSPPPSPSDLHISFGIFAILGVMLTIWIITLAYRLRNHQTPEDYNIEWGQVPTPLPATTPEWIKNATLIYFQKKNGYDPGYDPGYDQYAICLAEFEEQDKCGELKCKHGYQCYCIGQWLSAGNSTWPICRQRTKTNAHNHECKNTC